MTLFTMLLVLIAERPFLNSENTGNWIIAWKCCSRRGRNTTLC